MNTEAPIQDPKLVLLQAELLASTPAEVKAWLDARAQRPSFYRHEAEAPIEQALLGRNDPFIDLALARFGLFEDTLSVLFSRNSTEHDKALRVAALLNEPVGRANFSGLPTVLYSGAGFLAASKGKEQLEPFLKSLRPVELAALFSNPAIDNTFLVAFLEQKKPWELLDEQSRMLALMALKDNPRMAANYVGPMDGFAGHMHDAAFTAAFKLAETVPATMEWAHVLGGLYFKIKPGAYSVEDPIALAGRWVADPNDTQMLEADAEALKDGYAIHFAQVRQGIARLAVGRKKLIEVLANPDPAIRSAAYRDADLTPEQMREANTKDPLLGFNTMLYNKRLWRRPETRELLKEMAWEPARDPRHDLIPQNQYKSFSQELQKEFPAWFADEEVKEEIDTDSLPVSRGEFNEAIANVSRLIESPFPNLGNIERSVKTILGRSAWLWWGMAAAIALLLFKH